MHAVLARDEGWQLPLPAGARGEVPVPDRLWSTGVLGTPDAQAAQTHVAVSRLAVHT